MLSYSHDNLPLDIVPLLLMIQKHISSTNFFIFYIFDEDLLH